MVIGLPPVLVFGTKQMKETLVPDVLAGKKTICLAISEPTVGSDVAQLACTAVKTPDGKHYIVNGVKKWITNGMLASRRRSQPLTDCRIRRNSLQLLHHRRTHGRTWHGRDLHVAHPAM